MNNSVKVTSPMHCKEFKCIGGNCKYTCCMGWDIEVDKDTFNDYRNVKNKKIKDYINTNISENKECTSSDLDYAIIKLNRKKRCPFLNEKNYCSIYTELGEEYLSNICTHYPRILNKIDNQYELSLDVSCLEAAKIVLGQKDKIKFETYEKKLNKYIINDEYNTNSKKLKKSPIKYLMEIRDTSIKIMQNRKVDICMRLFILGNFIEKLEAKFKGNLSVFKDYIMKYESYSELNSLKREKEDYYFQFEICKQICDSINICEENISQSFVHFAHIIFKEINFDEQKDINTNIKKFMEYDKEVIQNNSYLFENYIVNFMYNNLFPFSENDSMFEGYIMLLIRFSFIRFYLLGTSMKTKYKSEEEIIVFIMKFARTIEHDKSYFPQLLNNIALNNCDNMNFAQKLL